MRSNSYRFLTEPPDKSFDELLGGNDRLLFQVWALYGFTNFGRVSTMTVTKEQLIRDLAQSRGLQTLLTASRNKASSADECVKDARALTCRLRRCCNPTGELS